MTIRLMQLFDFTLEDLAYNRRGELSPRQSVRVTNDRRALKRLLTAIGFGIIGVIGGPLAVMGWLALATDSATGVGMLAGAGFFAGAGVVALVGAPFLYLGLRPMRPVKVAAARGTARIARVQRTRRSSNNSTSTYVATELHLGAISTRCRMKPLPNWKTAPPMPSITGMA